MSRSFCTALAVLLFSSVAADRISAPARGAEAESPGTLSARGVSVVKRQPDTLRLQLELTVKAKTAKDAVAKLKTRREAALAQLAKLNAEKESIKASDPKVVPAQTDRQRQMEMMVRQRMRNSGKKHKKAPESAAPVAVATTLTAEWKLSAADPDARLLAAHDLEQKVRAADLAGGKDKESEASSPEEEEAQEEMGEMTNEYDDPNQPKPGEPMFVYVAKLNKDEQEKAYAAAFADARVRAERLAHAAGVALGELRSISGNAAPAGMQNYGYNRYMAQMYQQMYVENGGGDEGGTTLAEAIGPQAHEVTMTVGIEAQFAISPGAEKPSK